MDWAYKNSLFTSDMILDNLGFVYIIRNNLDNRAYIGKKLFYFSKVKYIKNRKRHIKFESDWKDYFGSCEELICDVAHYGVHNFSREILYLCKSKGVMSYLELREQMSNNVLLKPSEYYNGFVGGKIHRKHVLDKINL
jgi:hypothetical protein